MRTYEITYLTTSEENHDAGTIAPLLTEQKASITRVHPWGARRKLAFPIKKEDQAFFTTVVFEADPSAIAPLERALQLNNSVLRGLIVHFEPGIFDRTTPIEESTKPAEVPQVTAPATPETAVEVPAAATEAQVAETSTETAEEKPKRKRTTKKATAEEAKALEEKLEQLLSEDITK